MLTKNIEMMKREVAKHIAADAVVRGVYWDEVNGKGCFIGCLGHKAGEYFENSNHMIGRITAHYGIPYDLIRTCERIFENFTDRADAVQFFHDVPEAIGRDGKDLTEISSTFWKENFLQDGYIERSAFNLLQLIREA